MRTFLLAAAFALAMLTPAAAEHCATWSTDDDVELDTNPYGLPGPRYYWNNDQPNVECCPFGVWYLYEESNGLDGLQRADEMFDHTCHGMIQADTIVF